MFFNLGFSEPLTATLEQYVGNACVSRQQFSAPPEILQPQFIQIVQQVASQSHPMKIRMVRWEDAWDEFEGKWKKLELDMEFKN